MPALPPVPQVLAVRWLFDVGSDTHVSTKWHIKYTGGPPTNADAAAIASGIYTASVTDIIPLLALANSLEGVEVTDLTSATSAQGTHLAHTAGSRAGPTLAAEVTALVNIGIGRRYRGGKPRNYWPFGTATDLSNPQLWNPGFSSLVTGNLESLLAAIDAVAIGTTLLTSLVNVSYYSGFTVVLGSTGRAHNRSTPRAVPIVDVASSITCNPIPGSQRRRELHSL